MRLSEIGKKVVQMYQGYSIENISDLTKLLLFTVILRAMSLPEDVSLQVDDPNEFGDDVKEINSDPTQSMVHKAKTWVYGQVPEKYRDGNLSCLL